MVHNNLKKIKVKEINQANNLEIKIRAPSGWVSHTKTLCGNLNYDPFEQYFMKMENKNMDGNLTKNFKFEAQSNTTMWR